MLAMVLMAASLVSAFSVLTYNYYFDGMETSIRGLMTQAAARTELSPDGRGEVLEFEITDSWEKQSDEIRAYIEQAPEQPFQLYKYFKQSNILTRPQFGVVAMRVMTQDGSPRFIARVFHRPPEHHRKEDIRYRMLLILAFALTGLLIFLGLLVIILRTIAAPVEALGRWAQSLTPDRLRQTPPDFRYPELNNLAGVVHTSLNSVQESLDREHLFLRHASHELRTPIAVIRNNAELLNKLVADDNDKQMRVIDRIERASLTMTHLTDTLLWLGRDDHDSLPRTEMQLDQILSAYTDEQRYLLTHKSVTVTIDTHPHTVSLPETACRIVLTNLIRNAFQHTQSGTVHIEQKGTQISIINREADHDINPIGELGFGLGLALTDRLCQRLGWHYEHALTDAGYLAQVDVGNRANPPSA
jgi:signal transduction histidine kinase